MANRKKTETAAEELARLARESDLDDGLQSAGRMLSPSAAARLDEAVSTEAATLADVAHRDAPKLGRRPKVRRGTHRLVFRGNAGPVLHVSNYTTADGLVTVAGESVGAPIDWVEAAIRIVTGAKLDLLSHREERGSGIPDPRGPKPKAGERRQATALGFVVHRADGVIEFAGAGGAAPDVVLIRLRNAGFEPPAWLGEDLLNWLVQLASGGTSGGAGQLSPKRLGELLRDPAKLGRELMKRAGTKPELKSIAAKLPRKRSRRRA